MATDVDFCNRALNLIGSDAISGFQQTNDKAATCARQYQGTLSMLLSMAHWRFATRKRSLSPLLALPVNVYQYAYQLPSDLVAGPDAVYNSTAVSAPPITAGYEIFERTILTNESRIIIDYRFKPSENNFPDWFAQLLVLALAGAFAMGVTDQEDLAAEWNARAFGTPEHNMRGGFFAVCAQINRQGGGAKIMPTDALLAERNSL